MANGRTIILACMTLLAAQDSIHAQVPVGGMPIPRDSLVPLLRRHFAPPVSSLEVRDDRALVVTFQNAVWEELPAAVQFDRAYDVAWLLWDRYAAARGMDTIAARLEHPRRMPSDTLYTRQFYFYPAQLRTAERPRLASTR